MTTVESARSSLAATVAEYRSYRTLFLYMTIRDLKLRYRETALGVVWAIVQPLMPMLIFAAVFGRVLRSETGNIPYSFFVLSGLAPWAFFANAVTIAGSTFVTNHQLLNKVYFPRAILPVAAVAACIFDWLISTAFVMAAMLWHGFPPQRTWLLLPVVVAAGLALAMAVGLAAASLIVVYRDLKHLFPFLVQIWMYATPVIYPAGMIPKPLQSAAGLNPMTGVVEAFRWCLFGGAGNWQTIGLSALSILLLSIGALLVFRHLEADLAERA